MTWIAAPEAIALLAAQGARGVAELARLDRAAGRHPGDLHDLQRRASAAWDEVGARLLPDLDAGRLEALAGRLGAPWLAPAVVAERHEAERLGLLRTVAEIEARPEFSGPEAALAEVRARIADLREHLVALQGTLDALRSEPFFEELCDVEYDSPHYPIRWWTFTYYRHRRHADRIVARLGPAHGVATFAALRDRYREIAGALASLGAEREVWTTREATLERLLTAHAAAHESLRGLGERALGQLRGHVVEQLQARGPGAEALLADAPAALAALRRARGLAARRALLERLHAAAIERPRQALLRQHARDQRDVLDLARPQAASRRIDRALIERRAADRRPAWDRRHAAYEAAREALLGLDDDAPVPEAEASIWLAAVAAGDDEPAA